MNYNKDNADFIFNAFRKKGYSTIACCAILANLYKESALDPGNLQNSYGKKWNVSDDYYTQRVDAGLWISPDKLRPFETDGAGYGLGQWTSSGRKAGLLAYAKACGVSISNLAMQCDRIYIEIHSTGYANVRKALAAGTDLDLCTRKFMTEFERPANQSEKNQLARVECAKEFLAIYGEKEEEPVPETPVTEGTTREQVVEAMRYWEGAKTGNAKHKELIDLYNSMSTLPRGYKMSYKAAWCAATVTATAIKAGCVNTIIPAECSCGRMITLMKNMGIWEENDAYIPQPADIIFYDWSDNGVGDDTTGHDHVGIVESVSCADNAGSRTITVMEGNYSGMWKRRNIKVNARYIRGYGVPKYSNTSTPITTPKTYTVVAGDGLIKIASKLKKQGYNITWLQLAKLNNIKAPYIIKVGQVLDLE